ncbi:hypothetical protein BDZ85DRAFT_285729 [Elsinoe ampelina]|uniref:Uncharacterized protein n=1 Tax=Elsinoe ampelina TaxID=302913 RepID=A0A6A6G0I5_9PEZI|nr:hypothetical protein BDZ85DRAFT_285729 [Elsinoe ampelina]
MTEQQSPLTPPSNQLSPLSLLPSEILLKILSYLLPHHISIRDPSPEPSTYPFTLLRFPPSHPCPSHPLLALASTSHHLRSLVNLFALETYLQWPHLARHHARRKDHIDLAVAGRKSNIAELIWWCGQRCVFCGKRVAKEGRNWMRSTFRACCSEELGVEISLNDARRRYFLTDEHFFENLPGRPEGWPLIDCGFRYSSWKDPYRFFESDVQRLASGVFGGKEAFEAERERRWGFQHVPHKYMTQEQVWDVLPVMVQRWGARDGEAERWLDDAYANSDVRREARSLKEGMQRPYLPGRTGHVTPPQYAEE